MLFVRIPLTVALLLAGSSASAEDNWPRFRGPHGTGVAETPPDSWSTTENVRWITEIPGGGWSSPIVWGDRVFVTSAVSTSGNFKEPSTGIYGTARTAILSLPRTMATPTKSSGRTAWAR